MHALLTPSVLTLLEPGEHWNPSSSALPSPSSATVALPVKALLGVEVLAQGLCPTPDRAVLQVRKQGPVVKGRYYSNPHENEPTIVFSLYHKTNRSTCQGDVGGGDTGTGGLPPPQLGSPIGMQCSILCVCTTEEMLSP